VLCHLMTKGNRRSLKEFDIDHPLIRAWWSVNLRFGKINFLVIEEICRESIVKNPPKPRTIIWVIDVGMFIGRVCLSLMERLEGREKGSISSRGGVNSMKR
jgi:hypothetical protein